MIILSVNSFGQFTNSKTQSVYGGIFREDAVCFGSSLKLLSLKDGYLLSGYTHSDIGGNKTSPLKGQRDIWIVRLDSICNVLWDKTIGTKKDEVEDFDIVESNGDFFISSRTKVDEISGDKSVPSIGSYPLWLIKLDKNGNKLWDKVYLVRFFGSAGLLKLESSLLVGGPSWLKKIDLDGNVIWDSVYYNHGNNGGVKIIKEKNYIYLCADLIISANPISGNPINIDYSITKIDTNGIIVWSKTFGGSLKDNFKSAFLLQDQSIILVGDSESNRGLDKTEDNKGISETVDYWVIKIDSNGNKLWDRTIGGSHMDMVKSVIEVDNKIYLYGLSYSNKSGDKSTNNINKISPNAITGEDLWLVCLDYFGNKIFDRTIGGAIDAGQIYYINNHFVMTAVAGGSNKDNYRTVATYGLDDLWVFRYEDSLISNSPFKSVSGKVFADLGKNCQFDSSDLNLNNKLIYNHIDGNYSITNSGHYTIYLQNSDTAKLELINQNDSMFNLDCLSNQIQTVVLKDPVKTARLDFPVQLKKRGHCLDITSFSNSLLRAGRWGYYKLDYVNNGFDTAYNTKLEILIDTSLIDSIYSPHTYNLVGNKLIFPLGNLRGFEAKSINYSIKLKGRFLLGTSICHKAFISPNCSLYSVVNYDSTKITAKTKCISKNKIELELKNESNYNQKIASDIYIYKDDSLSNLSTFKLNANETKVLTYHLDSNTVFTSKLVLNNNDPVQPIIVLHDDKCALSKDFKPNNSVLNFHRQHDSREYEENCAIVRGSYDPNIKSVQPAGITSENYTSTGTELSYRIDFQNTGNDSAFRIVITDSLSESLNIATFIPGTSSHPYSVEFEKRKVKFIFDPIALVDSVTNEPGSHGYVTFKIKHNSNIKPKTKIENGASIYFDFNPPIITNKVFNTIYDVLLIVRSASGVDKTEKLPIKVYPNPVTNTLNIGLSEPVTQLSIEVLDIQGKLIKKILSPADLNVQINTENMENGIYILRCYSHDKVLIEQKIQVIR